MTIEYHTRELQTDLIAGWRINDLLQLLNGKTIEHIDLYSLDAEIEKHLSYWTSHDWTRCDKVDLTNPIIIDSAGIVIDGIHRLVKARILGHAFIDAVRLELLPEPHRIWQSWDEYDIDPLDH